MHPFETQFEELTGARPFPWQRRLYDRFAVGEIPSTCSLPTGLGKTSVITIWHLARRVRPELPRRLVYVVNRRTVVDQTTVEIERLRRAEIAQTGSDAGTAPLALSTLRGQLADNREWAADPSRPAVVCGTVDMIGSRLLFSGYRIGYKTRPLHAGFLGQDALIVHDEAHLEPAFQELLLQIEAEQRRAGDRWRLHVMELSATVRVRRGDVPTPERRPILLDDDDRAVPAVRERIDAVKRLTLHECDDRALVETVVQRVEALAASGRAIVVFLRTVEAVTKVVAKLGDRALALTGTLRGLERDRMVARDPIFRRFLPASSTPAADAVVPREGTVVLVATSAGEVGVNISADHLICDLSTYDSMAQRLGRVNRFGQRSDTEVHVLYPPLQALDAAIEAGKGDSELARRRKRTLALLGELGNDASPRALDWLDPQQRANAFAPPPRLRPASDILFDAWAMTTVRDHPGRPPVDEFLHGIATWEPPQTQVAWRSEVDWLVCDEATGPSRDRRLAELAQLLDDYPLKPHELLSDQTARVAECLIEAAGDAALAGVPLWIVGRDQRLDVRALGTLAGLDRKQAERLLAGALLLLSPRHSRPVDGLLTAASWAVHSDNVVADVADLWLDERGEARRLRTMTDQRPPGMRLVHAIALSSDDDDPEVEPRVWSWYERPFGSDTDGPLGAKYPVELDVHGRDVERFATAFVAPLRLPDDLDRAVIVAARLHDIGKARRIWQRAIGNRSAVQLAKGGRRVDSSDRTPYRHELGSVLNAATHAAIATVPEGLHDLVRHLIAAHHGRARPHFPDRELLDPESPTVDLAREGVAVQRRFVALQRRYGRWGLAYLESLVRAADYAASAEPSAYLENLP